MNHSNGFGRDVFSTGQIGKLLKVAPRTVAKWIDSGRIRAYRLPGSQGRRVTRVNLRKFLQENGMPDLETQGLHQVLLVGTPTVMTAKLRDALNEANGFCVRYSSTPFQAGYDIRDIRPDTIVIDLGMGRSEALQIARILRQQDAYAETLIFALAGEDEVESEKLLEQYDLTAVFRKPLDPADLAEAIGQVAK